MHGRKLILVLAMVLVFVLTLAVMLVISIIISPAATLEVVIARHPDEINRLPAGVVLGTVLGPFFGVPGWDMQVKRLLNCNRRAIHHYRLGINQRRWRCIANVDAAVHARCQSPLHRRIGIRRCSLRKACRQRNQRDKTAEY